MQRLLIALVVLLTLAARLPAQDIPLSKILIDKEGWREVAKGLPGITYLQAEPDGNIIFYENTPAGVLDVDGAVGRVPPGIKEPRNQKAIRDGRSDIIIVGKAVVVERRFKTSQLALPDLVAPNCLTVWPDEGHLVIGEADGAWLWAVRIETDGALGPGDRYYSLRTSPGSTTRVTAMTMDAGYLLYACTPLGIQVFDPTGRLSGVIAAPAKEEMTAITIGGEKADMLFIACGDKVYARKIQGKAPYTLKKK
jgi:gluconolactonase